MGILNKILGREEKQAEAPFVEITDENFEKEVIGEGRPVMLFVWSNTCPHCRKMAPNIKQAANRYADAIKAAHTSAGLAPQSLARLNVRSVPMTFFFNHGQIVESFAGFRPLSFLEEVIEAHFIEEQSEEGE